MIKFLVAQNRSPIQCWRELAAVYGDRGLGKTQVWHWHKFFKAGNVDTPTKDTPKTGQLRSALTAENIQLIQDLLEEDRRKTVRELVVQSGLTQGTVHQILQKELKLSWICAKFVPQLLTAEQKDHRAHLSALNLASLADDSKFFMQQIVSGDETWLYCFDPDNKQRSSQWHPKGSLHPTKALWSKLTTKKVMLMLFFDSEGPILIHFLPKGEIITADMYCEILAQLREAIRLKRPGMWQHRPEGRRSFLLHHDNATPHTAAPTLAVIGSNDIEMIPHPAYSPDLAPADFSVFPNLKEELRGHAFANVEDLKAETRKVLHNWPKDFFRRTIWDMAKRWAKCVASRGEYFEGRGVEIPPLPEFLDHSEEEWSDPETATDSDD